MKITINQIKVPEGPLTGGSVDWPSEILLENPTQIIGPVTIKILHTGNTFRPGGPQSSPQTITIDSNIKQGMNVIRDREWIGKVDSVFINNERVGFSQKNLLN